MKPTIFSFVLVIFTFLLSAQDKNPFQGYLPIREVTSLGWASAMNENEPILFEAKPTIYYQLYNTYNMENIESGEKVKQAFYLYFQSHFRMYQSLSLPVKTPSYRGYIGWQRTFNLPYNSQLTFAIETGHYSNGQSFSAWNEDIKDGTPQSDSIYKSIHDEDNLAEMLNRNSGNFSINNSKLEIQYVLPQKNGHNGKLLLHKLGAYYNRNHTAFAMLLDYSNGESDVQLVGKNEFAISYETFLETDLSFRWSFKHQLSYLTQQHKSINPLRYQATFSIYPKDWVTGFYVSYVYGRDNYNYRIVDSRNQFALGIHFDFYNLKQYRR